MKKPDYHDDLMDKVWVGELNVYTSHPYCVAAGWMLLLGLIMFLWWVGP